MEFWKTNVEDKVRKLEREGNQRNNWVDRQAEAGIPSFQGSSSSSMLALTNQPQAGNPPGTGKRALKRKAAELRRSTGQQTQDQPPAQRQRTEEAQRPEWADTKRADGRWIYDI